MGVRKADLAQTHSARFSRKRRWRFATPFHRPPPATIVRWHPALRLNLCPHCRRRLKLRSGVHRTILASLSLRDASLRHASSRDKAPLALRRVAASKAVIAPAAAHRRKYGSAEPKKPLMSVEGLFGGQSLPQRLSGAATSCAFCTRGGRIHRISCDHPLTADPRRRSFKACRSPPEILASLGRRMTRSSCEAWPKPTPPPASLA